VNVVGLPAVQLEGKPTVNVGNTPNVKIADARQRVAFSYSVESGALHYDHPFDELYKVPSGKRLQPTHVSALGSTGSGIQLLGIGEVG
jgi:hypothetical protein